MFGCATTCGGGFQSGDLGVECAFLRGDCFLLRVGRIGLRLSGLLLRLLLGLRVTIRLTGLGGSGFSFGLRLVGVDLRFVGAGLRFVGLFLRLLGLALGGARLFRTVGLSPLLFHGGGLLQRRGELLAVLCLLFQDLRQTFSRSALIGGGFGGLTADLGGGQSGRITALGRFAELFRQWLGNLLFELIRSSVRTRDQFCGRCRSFRSIRLLGVLRLRWLLTGLR